MKKAFNYMFEDNLFLQKFSYYYVFHAIMMYLTIYAAEIEDISEMTNKSQIANLLLAQIGCLIMQFFVCGYFCRIVGSLTKQKNNFILPHMNPLSSAWLGFKYSLANFLLIAAVEIIFLIVLIPVSLFLGATKLAFIPAILFIAAVIGIMALAFRFLPILTRSFSETGKISSFFKFKEANALIKTDSKKYIGSILFLVAANTPMVILITISMILAVYAHSTACNIVSALFSGACTTYFYFVSAYIIAKSVEEKTEY